MNPSDYDTDRDAHYLANYERWFKHLVGSPIKLLELGIQKGGSLRLWRDLFPGGTIAGLDLNPSPVPDGGGIRTFQGYQQDTELLERIAAEVAPEGFDVIIDDASHLGEYTAASFWHLFPRHLKPGGLYIIDDWSCAYMDRWPDGHTYKGIAAFRGTSRQLSAAEPSGRFSAGVERFRRGVRSVARPANRWFDSAPALQAWLKLLYFKVESIGAEQHFYNHDYGMAGFVKQLIDALAVDVIRAPAPLGVHPDPIRIIDRIEILQSQVLVIKSVSWE